MIYWELRIIRAHTSFDGRGGSILNIFIWSNTSGEFCLRFLETGTTCTVESVKLKWKQTRWSVNINKSINQRIDCPAIFRTKNLKLKSAGCGKLVKSFRLIGNMMSLWFFLLYREYRKYYMRWKIFFFNLTFANWLPRSFCVGQTFASPSFRFFFARTNFC